MNKLRIILGLFILPIVLAAQPNCEAFLYYGDTLKYQAWTIASKARAHYQFSSEHQTIMDEALAIDSTFDYPYWGKSIAYLKSGDFLNWKKLIDKAVLYNPKMHLGYRGWCRFQFFRDYQGAIDDIERLDSLVDYDIGQGQNGAYHLNVAKGLCFKGLGKIEKAIEVIERQIELEEATDMVLGFDYLHLGVLYLETGRYTEALLLLDKQVRLNNLAENHYYSALALNALGNTLKARQSLGEAEKLYKQGLHLLDPYSHPMDRVYLEDIQEKLESFLGE